MVAYRVPVQLNCQTLLEENIMQNQLSLKILAAAFFGAVICSATTVFAEDKAPPSDGVMPLNMPEQTNPEIKNLQDRLYCLALHQAHYVLTLVHPWKDGPSLKLATQSKSVEHFIRPNTGVIASFAFL